MCGRGSGSGILLKRLAEVILQILKAGEVKKGRRFISRIYRAAVRKGNTQQLIKIAVKPQQRRKGEPFDLPGKGGALHLVGDQGRRFDELGH